MVWSAVMEKEISESVADLTIDVVSNIMKSMSAVEKLLARMRHHPLDWQIGQLETVARHCGLKIRKPGGSHVIFQKDGCPLEVSVPAHKPIKPVYIRYFLALVDAEVKP